MAVMKPPRRVSRVTDAPRPAGPPRRPRKLYFAPALTVANPREQKVQLVLGLLWHDDMGQAEDEGHHKRRNHFGDHDSSPHRPSSTVLRQQR